MAHVTLKDGRSFDLATIVDAPRPRLSLLTKSVVMDESYSPWLIHFDSQDELPQDAKLNFFLKTEVPETFPPTEKVEVATADDSFRVLLSIKDGNLVLQDLKTIFAVLDPMKLLGPSAFGPLKFRAITESGIEGDWQPLVSLVRIPVLKAINCRSSGEKQCTLEGEKLFLIDAISAEPDFANSVTVPDGFVEASLIIPAPKGQELYFKLRDDRRIVGTVSLRNLNAHP
jgi:hypothetical protein